MGLHDAVRGHKRPTAPQPYLLPYHNATAALHNLKYCTDRLGDGLHKPAKFCTRATLAASTSKIRDRRRHSPFVTSRLTTGSSNKSQSYVFVYPIIEDLISGVLTQLRTDGCRQACSDRQEAYVSATAITPRPQSTRKLATSDIWRMLTCRSYRPCALQAPPVRPLYARRPIMEKAKGYRQQSPKTVQGPGCHAEGTNRRFQSPDRPEKQD